MFGIIGGLLIAWLLSIINVDRVIIDGVYQLFNMSIGTAGYYVLFAIIGLVTELFSNSFNFYIPSRRR